MITDLTDNFLLSRPLVKQPVSSWAFGIMSGIQKVNLTYIKYVLLY